MESDEPTREYFVRSDVPGSIFRRRNNWSKNHAVHIDIGLPILDQCGRWKVTSRQIAAANVDPNRPQVEWLREIAYQLAVLNERNAERDDEGVRQILKKVGLGSPAVEGQDAKRAETGEGEK